MAADAWRLYWTSWLLAAVFTGLVAGFMLGHALVLAPFLDWLTATPGLLGRTYPAFRGSAGRTGLAAFYAVAGVQILAGWLFLALALVTRRHRVAAAVAALAGTGWVILHYASGFGALEAAVLRSTTTSADLTRQFVARNAPIHFAHATLLGVALLALLSVPLQALRREERRTAAPPAHR